MVIDKLSHNDRWIKYHTILDNLGHNTGQMVK